MSEKRQEVLAKFMTGKTSADGYVTAPGNGATITLWDSGTNELPQNSSAHNSKGVRWKRLIISVFSSHASAASGLTIDLSFDDGANWDNLTSFTVNATTLTVNYVSVCAPRVRVRYQNSANNLTAFRGAVIGDEYERATQ